MDRLLPGGNFSRMSKVALAIAVFILVSGLVALILLLGHKNSSPTTGTKPASHMDGPKLPLPDDSRLQVPRYPQDKTPTYTLPNPGVVTAPVQAEPTNPPDVPPVNAVENAEGKGETYKLPAPVTQVHSLSEAGSVMGRPIQGQIGVPHVITLPAEANSGVGTADIHSVNAPIGSAADEIGAPPGVSPEEVGRSKTIPIQNETDKP
jgi:hypothetical protein